MTARVFFYVQHLLGIGHMFRALRIAHGLREAGFAVHLVQGGVPVPGLDVTGLNVIQLFPLKAGPRGFSDLVTVDGKPVGEGIKSQRTAGLLAAVADCRPDILLIEAFPFGRRQMRFELMPLLEAAKMQAPRPRIVSSIRDILQESAKPERALETVETLGRFFDGVVVHGDPRLVRLEATFPFAREIERMTVYSGIVAPKPASCRKPWRANADVVISSGGGAVGLGLIETAIAAKRATALGSARWLALAGPNAGAQSFERLKAQGAKAGVAVERFVPDLPCVLAGAQVSISQAGYNTVADVLSAGCRAVLVPFARNGETEQTRRAALLQERGLAVALAEDELTPGALAAAIDRAVGLPAPVVSIDLNGAANTARILAGMLADRQ